MCALLEAYENKTTDVARIVKDADYLEMAFQAKIYVEQGYSAAQERIINVGNALKTESAKQLWTEMQTVHSTDWWRGLMKIQE
ncbi:HD domain-containing protein [Patescibacteria group bacterium]|nr:HD domain-containing protein [Patescibacteria group bacterium]